MNKKQLPGRYGNFWAKVIRPSDDCWLWTGATKVDPSGRCLTYGRAWYRGKQQKAHRVSWQMRYGEIPNGLYVLHRCDVPLCVKPEHLFLGTQIDNIKDMVAKRRQRNG